MEYLYTCWLPAKNVVRVGVEERNSPPNKKSSTEIGDDIKVTLHIMSQWSVTVNDRTRKTQTVKQLAKARDTALALPKVPIRTGTEVVIQDAIDLQRAQQILYLLFVLIITNKF